MVLNELIKDLSAQQQEIFSKLAQKDGILENIDFNPLSYNQYFDSKPMTDTLKNTCITKINTEELLDSLQENLISKFLQSADNNNKIIDTGACTSGYILLALNSKKVVAYFQEEQTRQHGLLHMQFICNNSYGEDTFSPHYISNFYVECEENAVSALVNINTLPSSEQISELFYSCRAFEKDMSLFTHPRLVSKLRNLYPQYKIIGNYSCIKNTP